MLDYKQLHTSGKEKKQNSNTSLFPCQATKTTPKQMTTDKVGVMVYYKYKSSEFDFYDPGEYLSQKEPSRKEMVYY